MLGLKVWAPLPSLISFQDLFSFQLRVCTWVWVPTEVEGVDYPATELPSMGARNQTWFLLRTVPSPNHWDVLQPSLHIEGGIVFCRLLWELLFCFEIGSCCIAQTECYCEQAGTLTPRPHCPELYLLGLAYLFRLLFETFLLTSGFPSCSRTLRSLDE